IQDGTGTTYLNAPNTYSGATVVNNGELFITPVYQASGNVTVANGARFGVSAAAVTNSAVIGALTLGSGGSTTLDFSYNVNGNPTNTALSAASVNIVGNCTVRIGGSFVPGTFPVLHYGSLSGAFNPTVVGPRGVTASLFNDTVNQTIMVTVSSVGNGIVWTGTNSVNPNVWDINTTANWLIGGLATTYIETVPPGDAVTFNDQGSALVNLSNSVSPTSMQLANATQNYVFQGAGQINAPGGLVKQGAGSVTLSVPGNFGSPTVLSNGTINLGASQTFANLSGNSPVTVVNGSPTVTLNNSLNTAFAGNLSGALTLNKTGTGNQTLTGSNVFSGNLFVAAGALILDSGSIALSTYTSIGHLGTDNGSFTMKGAAQLTSPNDFNVGDVGASVGTLNVQDTAQLTVNAFYVGSANGSGSTASGTVNQTGGDVSVTNPTAGTFCIGGRVDGTSSSASGAYNISGGTLTVASTLRIASVGTGAFSQSGGTVTATSGVDISRLVTAIGSYDFNGGTLKTLSLLSSSGFNATVRFNGGRLVPLASSANFVSGLMEADIRNGGLIIDTTNFNVTLNQAFQHSTVGGDNAVDGGLTKVGNGILTLGSQTSTYTGPTLVLGGGLTVQPSSATSLNSLTVSNAALGANLNGGASPVVTAGIQFLGNNQVNLNYGLVSSTPVAAIAAAGALNANGINTLNLSGYGFTVGQFPLVTYTGSPLANLSHFQLGALPVGVTAVLTNNTANNSIDLVISSVTLTHWIPLSATDAAGTSSFNVAGNWQDGNAPATGNGYFAALPLRSPADTNNYTFGGSILAIDTGGRFLLKGINGQVLTVTNLVLSGGLLDYANGGDNFVETLEGNVSLNGGTLSYLGALGSAGASETFYLNAAIGGNGDVQLGGAVVNGGGDNGVVIFNGTNTYTGKTILAGGTLLVNGLNGTSPVTVATTATLGGNGYIAGPVAVQSGGTLSPGMPGRGVLTAALGTLTLGGTLSVDGAVTIKIDPSASPVSSKVIAPAITVNNGASLVVTNIGTTNFVAGQTFTLFNTA
ncbi:MAG TPA: autotransporter-associated beta strand repeat-containing protein, partial [Verrucomicrobiae bacterium]